MKKQAANAINKFIVLGEMHILAGALPAMLLPLIGFIAACIQVRYKKQYTENCISGFEDGGSSFILAWIRVMQLLTYLYSVSYFFLIRSKTFAAYSKLKAIIFTAMNMLLLVGGIVGFIGAGTSNCRESTTYETILLVLNLCCIIFTIIELVLAFYFF